MLLVRYVRCVIWLGGLLVLLLDDCVCVMLVVNVSVSMVLSCDYVC